MAIARLVRQAKRPYGLWVKMTAVTIMGLCFIFVWGVFSNPSTSVTTQRESFEDIAEPVSSSSSSSVIQAQTQKKKKPKSEKHEGSSSSEPLLQEKNEKKNNGSSSVTHKKVPKGKDKKGVAAHGKKQVHKENKETQNQEKEEGEEEELEGKEERLDGEGDVDVHVDVDGGGDLVESVDQDGEMLLEDGESVEESKKPSKGKMKGPLFDPNAKYKWKLCSTRSKHNYIPCIDFEVGSGRVASYRHSERSCPRTPLMCLVPLPHQGYESPVPWPESKLKVYEKVDKLLK